MALLSCSLTSCGSILRVVLGEPTSERNSSTSASSSSFSPVGAHEHQYVSSVTVQSTCQSEGVTTYTCSVCGHSYNEKFSAKKYTGEEIFNYAKNSIAEITTYNQNGAGLSLGSGFVYKENGQIITNFHVIDGAYSAKVSIAGKQYDVEQIIAYDINIDIAILKINKIGLTALPVCDKDVNTGSTVYALGSSQGLTATLSNGIVTHADRISDGVEYVQHNAAISSGNSGGPLLNEYGEVIGINTFTLKDSQNLNFAIFSAELDNLANKTPITFKNLSAVYSNPFNQTKNYIMSKGTYEAEQYLLQTTVDFNAAQTEAYVGVISYIPEHKVITLSYAFAKENSSFSYEYILAVYIWAFDGNYQWYYQDAVDNCYIKGSLNAATYTGSLSYQNTTFTSSSKQTIAINNAQSMLTDMLTKSIPEALSPIGVTAKTLGFTHIN